MAPKASSKFRPFLLAGGESSGVLCACVCVRVVRRFRSLDNNSHHQLLSFGGCVAAGCWSISIASAFPLESVGNVQRINVHVVLV